MIGGVASVLPDNRVVNRCSKCDARSASRGRVGEELCESCAIKAGIKAGGPIHSVDDSKGLDVSFFIPAGVSYADQDAFLEWTNYWVGVVSGGTYGVTTQTTILMEGPEWTKRSMN